MAEPTRPSLPPGERARWWSSDLLPIVSCDKGESIKCTRLERTNETQPNEQNQRDRRNDRQTTPGPNTFNPDLASPARAPPLDRAGTSQHPSLPRISSPYDRILASRNTQRVAYAGICLRSILWHFPPPSSTLSAGDFTGCSGGRDAPRSAAFCMHTTSTCRSLGVQAASDTYQPAHVRS